LIENESNKNTVEILSQEIERLSVVLGDNIEDIRKGDREVNRMGLKIEELQLEIRNLK
jgi:hypothetical protein